MPSFIRERVNRLAPSLRQSLSIRISRDIFHISILTHKIIVEGTEDAIGLPHLQAEIGRIDIGHKAEGGTGDGVVGLALMRHDGHVEGTGVATRGEITLPDAI